MNEVLAPLMYVLISESRLDGGERFIWCCIFILFALLFKCELFLIKIAVFITITVILQEDEMSLSLKTMWKQTVSFASGLSADALLV